MATLFSSNYWLARYLFQKGIAAIYLIAFLVAINQFPALLGENGFLPVARYLSFVTFNQSPSIFHFYYSDTFLLIIAFAGTILSLIALFGFSERGPWWISALVWFILWALYLSIVNVGQAFYSFGWETLLLEAGFIAIFIGSRKIAIPLLMIFLIRWLLFRIEFGAGLIKIRGDECWRNLTCLFYHHETQPMPNPLSWYFHQLPLWMHKIEVAGNHFFQLIVPWGLFFPQPVAAIAAGLIIISQLWLVLSGNFSWLNWTVIVLAVSGFKNSQVQKVLPIKIPTVTNARFQEYLATAAAILIIILSFWPIMNLLSKRQLMNTRFNNYRIVNTYGAFGSVTKNRYEIIIEGTRDTIISPQIEWKEYEFKGKPGDVRYLPRQFAPYHLRLDWLMWFLPFNLVFNSGGQTGGPTHHKEWFVNFIVKLLKNDSSTLKLIRKNPFPVIPPHFIRARVYEYKFTTPSERKTTGAWWKRKLVGEYLPLITLKE